MDLKEQFEYYANLCINTFEFIPCYKDANSLVFLDLETETTIDNGKKYKKFNVFRVAEFDLENEKIILQKSNDVDIVANIKHLNGLNFFTKLKDIKDRTELKKIMLENIREISIDEFDNYNSFFTAESLIYYLKDKYGIEDQELFQELSEFLSRNSKKYEFLENFQNSNISLYIKLILYCLYKIGKFYDFENQKIYVTLEEKANLLSII